jgi:hypothetical protein
MAEKINIFLNGEVVCAVAKYIPHRKMAAARTVFFIAKGSIVYNQRLSQKYFQHGDKEKQSYTEFWIPILLSLCNSKHLCPCV